MTVSRPRLLGVLETVLYYGSEQAEVVERFYEDVLGLRPIVRFETGIAFRADRSVYLLFDRSKTSEQGRLAHAAAGSIHTCFLASADEYEGWKDHLSEQGVPLVAEITWKKGIRSFYFHDPAGNLLEIAEGDLWPP